MGSKSNNVKIQSKEEIQINQAKKSKEKKNITLKNENLGLHKSATSFLSSRFVSVFLWSRRLHVMFIVAMTVLGRESKQRIYPKRHPRRREKERGREFQKHNCLESKGSLGNVRKII